MPDALVIFLCALQGIVQKPWEYPMAAQNLAVILIQVRQPLASARTHRQPRTDANTVLTTAALI